MLSIEDFRKIDSATSLPGNVRYETYQDYPKDEQVSKRIWIILHLAA